MRAHIALGVYGRAGFEHEHFKAALGQFFRGHAARCARTDDDRVVDFLLRHWSSPAAITSWKLVLLQRAEAIMAFDGEARSSLVTHSGCGYDATRPVA